MKKSKLNEKSTKKLFKSEPKEPEEKKTLVPADSIEDPNGGFGSWLRSSQGMENMKLFVIANSIVLLTTLVYPHIFVVWEIISDAFYGPDGLFLNNN